MPVYFEYNEIEMNKIRQNDHSQFCIVSWLEIENVSYRVVNARWSQSEID
jgi:hypothetical protein